MKLKPETGNEKKKRIKCLEIKPYIQITHRSKKSQGKLARKVHVNT